ncbi:DNA-binding response regulator [Opitutaceae bacterium EW11]|nr:DNA-binding response regulator [Opitutaceae bacterium EW11]
MNSTLPTKPIRLVIVDDSEVVRMGLRTLLTPEPMIRIVGEAGNVAQSLAVSGTEKPEVVLMDIRLPDGTGFDACRRILQSLPECRVLFLTSVVDDKLVDEAIRCGGHGYLLKEINGRGLIQAIFDVAAGKSILDPAVTARVMKLVKTAGGASKPLESLSAQERRVLSLIAEGKTNKEVGVELNLSEKTVKNYLANIFDKLAVSRRSQAVAMFVSSEQR